MRDIAEVLSASGLRWWIDSGTLLALVREGELFPADKDLDLGCWANQDDQLARALSELQRRGYRVGRRRYQGRICKYWLRPKPFSGERSVDLKLYTQHGDLAICPVAYTRSRTTVSRLAWLAAEAIRWPIAVLWRRRFRRPWRLRLPPIDFLVVTWTLPARFLDTIEEHIFNDTTLPMPSPVAEYLAFRYGEWRNPVSDWVTHRDDRGLVLDSPDAVLARRKSHDS